MVYNSRLPRPGEEEGIDYYFRTRSDIESFRQKENMLVVPARDDLHAIDMDEVDALTRNGDVVYEGNVDMALALMNHDLAEDLEVISIFISPLCRAEIEALYDLNSQFRETVTEVMRRKLLRRLHRHKELPSLADLQDIETRAGSAYSDMRKAYQFDYIVPNHDGEDSENWTEFGFALGDARNTVLSVAGLLRGGETNHVEHWSKELLQQETH